ncbi:L-dopachrome tautomerase-related protein [Frateuria aurantia]
MRLPRPLLQLSAGLGLALSLVTARADDTIDQGARPMGELHVVAAFDGPGPSGIAVTPGGRIFVGFPRHAENHPGPALAELKDGRLIPYPSRAFSLPSQVPWQDQLVSPHGMTTDSRGRLWLIDDGKIAGHPIEPGQAKVVGIDPATNRVFANIVIRPPAMLADSHLNDLRVDLSHGSQGTVYIADSSFGTSPALIVVDVASGRQRRVLAGDRSTSADPGFVAMMEGRPLRYDPTHPSFPIGGVDGITLSPDQSRLYYTPLSSRRLYSIPTAVLSDFNASEQRLAAAVRDEGDKGAADGLATDPQGRIYTTDFEHDAIRQRQTDGSFRILARDPRIVWPDGIYATGHQVYVVLGQWDRLPGFNHGHDLRQPPYLLVSIPTDPAPRLNAADVR